VAPIEIDEDILFQTNEIPMLEWKDEESDNEPFSLI
jgi:hypothetical protein